MVTHNVVSAGILSLIMVMQIRIECFVLLEKSSSKGVNGLALRRKSS